VRELLRGARGVLGGDVGGDVGGALCLGRGKGRFEL
jgi:hypothetical protein